MSERPVTKLRRCPCCGGDAYWSHRRTENFLPRTTTVSELWRIHCFNCNMRTAWSDSLVFIASEWNRVAPPTEPTPAAQRDERSAA